MSGEGAIASVREIRRRVDAVIAERNAPRFDRRPGALEATRGLTPTLIGAIGVHRADGWGVRLQVADGQSIDLTMAQARERAVEILTLCDTLELGVPD